LRGGFRSPIGNVFFIEHLLTPCIICHRWMELGVPSRQRVSQRGRRRDPDGEAPQEISGMYRFRLILAPAVLLAAAFVASGAGEDSKEKPSGEAASAPSGKATLAGTHAQMAKVCELSDEQIDKVAALADLRHRQLEQFDRDNAEKTEGLRAAIAKAKEAKDQAAARKARAEKAVLNERRNEITDKSREAILGVLTAKQLAVWRRYMGLRALNRRFSRAGLTDAQRAKLAEDYDRLVAGADPDDKNAVSAARAKLNEHVEKEILTEAQRAAMKAGRKPDGAPTSAPSASKKP
jgi:Spy/CpxP family protein refolding chaperone